MIDLHIHTTASDGKINPEEISKMAYGLGLKAIAITDHETIDGIAPALETTKRLAIEIIPGIEIKCCVPETNFEEVDIVGLLIDHNNKNITEFIKDIKQKRVEQKKKSIMKLNGLGYDINIDEVLECSGGSIGYPHIAQVLIKKYPKKFTSVREVFDKYLGRGKSAHVNREMITLKECINIIKKAGGVSFLAHPGIYGKKESVKLIEFSKKKNVDGVETYYPYHNICPSLVLDKKMNDDYVSFYRRIAAENNFLETGGSDFHEKSRDVLGCMDVPDNILKKIKEFHVKAND